MTYSKPHLFLLSLAFAGLPAFALTGGPAMPEYAAFEEVSATKLVDPVTGNFTYAIPAVEVPGPGGSYPMALSYHSGITHGQEASWVGLGWNLNPGSINRVLKGVPDDYLNSLVTTRYKYTANGAYWNVGMGFGTFGMSMRWDMKTGEYQGGDYYFTASAGLGIPGAPPEMGGIGLNVSESGVSVSASVLGVGARYSIYQTGPKSNEGPVSFSMSGTGMRPGSTGNTHSAKGKTTYGAAGMAFPVGYVSVFLGISWWNYTLDDSKNDYMCGYLFQDGSTANFPQRPVFTGSMPSPKLSGQAGRRQRFERSKQGDRIYPAGDAYSVSATGLSGTFDPVLEPSTTSTATPIPVIKDGESGSSAENNEGWKINNAPAIGQINFRMSGDPGFNLLQDATIDPKQSKPSGFAYELGAQEQYGSNRIKPVFETGAGQRLNRLKGFVITNPDGIRYEYLQPVYNLFEAGFVFSDPQYATENRNQKLMAEKYASSWLITAVKGADYVSVPFSTNAEIVPKEGDWGHWVKMSYTAPEITSWSAPFTGNLPEERGTTPTGNLMYMRSFGHKELVYPSAVETQTHIAKFTLEDRLDARYSENSPWVSNRKLDPGRTRLGDMYTDELHAFNVFPQSLYNGSLTSEVPVTEVTLVFPGNWVEKCQAYAIRTWYDNYGVAPDPNESNIPAYRRYCLDIKMGRQYKASETNLYQWEHGIAPHGEWETMTLNANGDTEVKAKFWYSDQQHPTYRLEIESAAVNWTLLETGLIKDPKGKDPAVHYKNPKLLKRIDLYSKQDLANPIKTVDLKYNYSLCGNTPNSFADPATMNTSGGSAYVTGSKAKGKLTLMRVDVLGRKYPGIPDRVQVPSYSFGYQGGASGNPDYGNEMNQDVWGMYSPTATYEKHLTRQTQIGDPNVAITGGETVGACWNLNFIRMPTGGKIDVKYQRDSYYLAGVAKEKLNNGRQIAVPDIFSAIVPYTAPNPDYLDYGPLPLIQKATSLGIKFITRPNAAETGGGYTTNQIPLMNPGPALEEDFVQVNSVNGLAKGDMVMVSWSMSILLNGTTSQAGRGILNFCYVKKIDGTKVYLHPLVQVNPNNKFFLFQDFEFQNVGFSTYTRCTFEYRIIPLNRPGKRKEFFGGDVAVKELTTGDGFGNSYTTKYEYYADNLRSDGATDLAGGGFSSGATFGLPSLQADRYYRFWSHGNDAYGLRFQAWPAFRYNEFDKPVVTPKNSIKDWVDQAYFSDTREGGYYFPGPGITYSRVTTQDVDPANTSASIGKTELQFEGLAYKILHLGGAFNDLNITANLQYGDWSAIYANNRLDVVDDISSKKGKVMRVLVRGADNIVIRKSETSYMPNVPILTKIAADGTPETEDAAFPLGNLRQTYGYQVQGGTVQTVSCLQRNHYPNRQITVQDGVGEQSDNLFFDVRSGSPLVTKNTNSDGKSLIGYSLPAWWYLPAMSDANRLNPIQENRQYLYTDASVWNRNDLTKVVGAEFTIWDLVNRKAGNGTGGDAVLAKRSGHVWKAPLAATGYPTTAYVLPNSSNVPNNPLWTETSYTMTMNEYSNPISMYLRYTNSHTAEYMGHGTNLAVAHIVNSSFSESAVLTCDYDRNQNGYYDKVIGWAKGSLGISAVVPDFPHFGLKSMRVQNGYGPGVTLSVYPSSHPVYRFSLQHRVVSGSFRMTLQPRNESNANVGAKKTLELNAPAGQWAKADLTIDLREPQYSSASRLYAEIYAPSGNVYMDDLRVHPEDAMVSTAYYDPATQELLTAVDANSSAKRFRYDGIGRLTQMLNNNGDILSSTSYKSMENPQ